LRNEFAGAFPDGVHVPIAFRQLQRGDQDIFVKAFQRVLLQMRLRNISRFVLIHCQQTLVKQLLRSEHRFIA
jgi:hypothetical protein